MGAPENEFLALGLQRQAYAKMRVGAGKLADGILYALGAFMVVYFVPTILTYVFNAGLQNTEQQISPTLALFDPFAALAYLTVGLMLSWLWIALFFGMIALTYRIADRIIDGADLIHKGMTQLSHIGAPGPGPFDKGGRALMLGAGIMVLTSVPFAFAALPGNPLGSLGFFIVQLVMDIAFALIAVGLITLGVAFWRCGSACGQGDVKEGGAAIVVGMVIFLLSWGTILAFQLNLVTMPLRPGLAALLFPVLAPALPAYCVLGFITAYIGIRKAFIGIRRLV